MLEDVHELKAAGVDMLPAVIETHGRVETASLIAISNVCRCGRIDIVRDAEEADVDAVIARIRGRSRRRTPHTNVPARRITNVTKTWLIF